ncbi:hypothetical protein [Paraburkholderia sediminicola]|uniref:hypothetical protein n=1 Tax=Paraburkholderia sediminicola TaxID=458836 RepID=UPI0038BB4F4B
MGSYLQLILKLALPIILIVAAGGVADLEFETDLPETVTVAAAAVITFAFFLAPSHFPNSDEETRFRRAVAAAIIVAYLVMVSIAVFFIGGPDKLPPLTESLISSFTTFVGVVLAAYFGSSAYVEGQKRKYDAQARKSSSEKNESRTSGSKAEPHASAVVPPQSHFAKSSRRR